MRSLVDIGLDALTAPAPSQSTGAEGGESAWPLVSALVGAGVVVGGGIYAYRRHQRSVAAGPPSSSAAPTRVLPPRPGSPEAAAHKRKLLYGAGIGAGVVLVGVALYARPIDFGTPARSLTWQEAMDEVQKAAAAGQVRIVQPYGRALMIAPEVNGVKLFYRGGMSETPRARGTELIDPRLLVLLLRWTRWDPTLRQIIHAGIYPGGNAEDTEEAHNRGTAIDISKMVYADGSDLDILRDWGMKGAWTGHYRLVPADKGYKKFAALYQFLASQATDRPVDGCGFSGENKPGPSTIGDKSFLITPDQGSEGLASRHRDHIHAQVGPTRECGGRSALTW